MIARLVVSAALATSACSGFIDRRAADSTYKIVAASGAAAQREADVELARAALPAGVVQLAAFAQAYPDHAGFRALHAEATCQYAIAFVYDDWDAATLAGRTDDAAHLADRVSGLLARCEELTRARLAPARRALPLAQLAATATASEAPILLWLAQAGSIAIALAPLAHLGDLAGVEAALATCARLAPGAREATAEVMQATLAASKPAIAGGDPSGAGFARARTLAGEGAFLVDVLEARVAAVGRGDRARFTQLLEGVLARDPARWPERRLGNELARAKARRYLAAIDRLFPTP